MNGVYIYESVRVINVRIWAYINVVILVGVFNSLSLVGHAIVV